MENIRELLQTDKVNYNDNLIFPSALFEAISLIPVYSKKVLDIGCGTGMGKAIAEKLNKNIGEYHGIEFNNKAIEQAKKNLDFFYNLDIENCNTDIFSEKSFDVIMLNDVIEHLVYPELTLKKFLKLLKPDGCLIMSIPNVMHQSVLLNLLLNGRWIDGGVAVKEHLSFFTLNDIKDFLSSTGLAINELIAITTDPDPAMRAVLKAAKPWMKANYQQSILETNTFQYVFKAAFSDSAHQTEIRQVPNIIYNLE